jgi:Na+/H+ antiporter NhaD/arsenite permease-like protein
MTLPILFSSLIFGVSLFLILSEKVNRTIVALFGAAVMISFGLVFGFYSEEQALRAIDLKTIGLLLGMMILVALLQPTGFFQFLAVWAGRVSKGDPVRLLLLLGSVTTLLSMFLDNVTTVVLIAPVTILISEVLGINPLPYLVSEALLSNTGGVATLVGDPPNVLISSAAGLSFNDFLTHSLPVILIVWPIAVLTLRYLFRKELACPPTNVEAILKLNPSQALEDQKTIRRVLIVLIGALIFFFFQEALHISPALIALSAAGIALIWVKPTIDDVLHKVEWSVLLFFAGLFIMVGGLEASGALEAMSGFLGQLKGLSPVILGVILIWVIAIVSAVVDNVPITIAMIPVIQGMSASGISIQPLWWALVFGAGLGGNATIIGSTANIVVTSLSEKTHTPITTKLWNRRGLPVMLITCTAASLVYVLFFPWLSR